MKTAALLVALLALCCFALLFDHGRLLDFALLFGDQSDTADAARERLIAIDIRLPRVLAGVFVGAALGSCGTLLQAIFHNPLASPFTLGTSAGAALGGMAVMILLPAASAFAVGGAAFAGALLISLPVLIVAMRRQVALEAVLLTGVALSFAAVSIGSALTFISTFSLNGGAISKWSMGSLTVTGGGDVAMLMLAALLPVAACFAMRGRLDAMLAGEEWALARGVNTGAVRGTAIVAVALSVGVSVALCGPIGFVGLMAPHMARGIAGATVSRIALAAPLVGAIVLVGCDWVARNLLVEPLPTGVMTAALGTPAFIVLLLRRFRRGQGRG